MKKILSLVLALTAFSVFMPASASAAPKVRKMTFHDEFSGKSLNRKVWDTSTYTIGNGGSGEQQQYVDDAFIVKNGILTITPKKQAVWGDDKKTRFMTSGKIQTTHSFKQQYGYFEMRAKFPKGHGMWPAFWLLPHEGPAKGCHELDVVEFLGKEHDTAHMTIHWGSDYETDHEQEGFTARVPNISGAFHTYAVDWRKDHITWFIDGAAVATTRKGIPHQPLYLILNLALGGRWGGNIQPATVINGNNMEVDYVRVYE